MTADASYRERNRVQCSGNTVGEEAADTAPNASRHENALHNGRQTRPCEDNVSCSLGCISGTKDCNTLIGSLQRWRVVHAIACHAHSVAELTETLNNQILVLRVCLRKAISSQEPVIIVSAQVCRLLLGFLVQEKQTVVVQ